MSTPEIVTAAILLLESILVLACFLAALRMRLGTGGGRKADKKGFGAQSLADLRSLGQTMAPASVGLPARLQAVKTGVRLHKDDDALAAVLHHVLNGGRAAIGLETVIGQVLSREEKGAIGICTLLTKSGPLSGLAGMLVGVSQALSLYLAQGCNPQTFIAGFALSIMATFWGVMIALLALFTARALWLPYLARRRLRLLDAAQEAMTSLATIESRRPQPPEVATPAAQPLAIAAVDVVLQQPLPSPEFSI